MLRVLTLMDNKPSENKALVNEHGLSYLVETDSGRFLFDCGAGKAVWQNAHRLGIDTIHIDGVVLSHSHYDHAAGYRDLVEQNGGNSVLYTGPHFFEPKYAFDGVKYTDLSAGFTQEFLKQHHIDHRECSDILPIAPKLWLIGGFPRTHSFETIPERFVKNTANGIETDLFDDEICLAAETEKGLVVLVGCSHPGILNIIEHVYHTLNKPIYAVFGGTHLVEANESRINETVQVLQSMGLTILGLSHCSGELAEYTICRNPDVTSCHMAVGDCVIFSS